LGLCGYDGLLLCLRRQLKVGRVDSHQDLPAPDLLSSIHQALRYLP
jgi:hypothetical protein